MTFFDKKIKDNLFLSHSFVPLTVFLQTLDLTVTVVLKVDSTVYDLPQLESDGYQLDDPEAFDSIT